MNSRKHKLWLFLELHLSVPKRLNKDSFYQTRGFITILILLLLELVPIQGILPESVFLLFSSTGFTPKSSFFCFVNAKVVVLHEGKLSPWEYGLFREERSWSHIGQEEQVIHCLVICKWTRNWQSSLTNQKPGRQFMVLKWDEGKEATSTSLVVSG